MRSSDVFVVTCTFAFALLCASYAQPGLASYEEGMAALDRWETREAIVFFEQAKDARSLRQLGEIHRSDDFIPFRNFEKYFNLVRQSAALGDPISLRIVGESTLRGTWIGGTPVGDPPVNGIPLLDRACALGEAAACLTLARCLNLTYEQCKKIGIEANEARSKELVARWRALAVSAAQAGDERGFWMLCYAIPEIGYGGDEAEAFRQAGRARNIRHIPIDIANSRNDPTRPVRVGVILDSFEKTATKKIPRIQGDELRRLVAISRPRLFDLSSEEIQKALEQYAYISLTMATDQLVNDSAAVERGIREDISRFAPRLRKALAALRAEKIENEMNAEQWLGLQFESKFSRQEMAYWTSEPAAAANELNSRIEDALLPAEARVARLLFELKKKAGIDPKAAQEIVRRTTSLQTFLPPENTDERFSFEQRTNFFLKEYAGFALTTSSGFAIRYPKSTGSLLSREFGSELLKIVLVPLESKNLYPLLTRSNISALRTYRDGVLEKERRAIMADLDNRMLSNYSKHVRTVLEEFAQGLTARSHVRQ